MVADSLTNLVIIFLVVVIATFIMSVVEFASSWRHYKAIKDLENDALRVIAISALFKSLGSIVVQFCFVVLAVAVIDPETRHLDRNEVIFIVAFLAAECLLCVITLNDLVSRKKLEEIVSKYIKE